MKDLIVIVENDPDLLQILTLVLSELDYEVIGISNSNDPVKIASTNPSLIILDEKLDDGFGHDVCLALKNNPLTHHIPIILFSAVQGLEQIALGCKADGFIEKPFDLDHFERVVYNILSRNKR